MGWFDGVSEVSVNRKPSRKHSSSSSVYGHGSSGRKHSSSGSIFGMMAGVGESNHTHHPNSSRGSIFSMGRSSSYYKRSSRKGFFARMYRKLRHLLRDLLYYLKHNPFKVFMLVILPLITGGALTALLRTLGIRLPDGVERAFAALGGRSHGGGGGGVSFERTSYEGPLAAVGGMAGMAGGAGQLLNVAKMFL